MRRTLSLLAGLGAAACAPNTDTTIGPAESAEDPSGSIAVFLHPPDRPSPTDTCDAEHCRALLELLDGAERTIDFAVYGMRNQTALLQAIERAQARGVDVRGVVDRDRHGANYYSSTDQWIEKIGPSRVRSDQNVDEAMYRKESRTAGPAYQAKCNTPQGFQGPVQCLAYDLGDRCLMAAHSSHEPMGDEGAIMHDKFFVVDGRFVWTGSTNVSDSCSGGYNANAVAVIDSRRIATAYSREVDQMFDKGRFHDTKTSAGPLTVTLGNAEVEVLFSPQDSPIRERVRPLVKAAKQRIDVGVFYLTHKHLAGDLIDAHLRGVKVRVILDATAATNGYTKHELLRAAGIPVKVENWGGKMHMKTAMIDGHTVITGSMNFTTAGEDGNDENVVIVRSEPIAAQYAAFFDERWAEIPDKWLQGSPDPEGRDSGTACTDGIDNDFDHIVDAEDPGCGDAPPPIPKLPPHWIKPKDRITCEW